MSAIGGANFFEQQAEAKRLSRWLIFAFILSAVSVSAIIAGIGLLIMAISAEGNTVAVHWPLFFAIYFGILFIIIAASLGKTAMLRSGGGSKVAQDMGGLQITPETRNRLHRRYYNVVEEVAIASGVPVPAVFVMEREKNINAFAAGYDPDDAAIAVTQGTLEQLTREELQGVVAHEFSHILNGDMRLNIRLMGVIFGIIVLTVIGKKVLEGTRYVQISSSRNREGGNPVQLIIVIAIALIVVGSIGVFFANWIKASVSRQREYLADASAVQFTRNPEGISGALKKIAVSPKLSQLNASSEEIGHMLFSFGRKQSMFSTHPPIMERIQRWEPQFDERALSEFADQLIDQREREIQAEQEKAERAEAAQQAKQSSALQDAFNPGNVVDQIGSTSAGGIIGAAVLLESMSQTIKDRVHDAEWVMPMSIFLLLSNGQEQRIKELTAISSSLSALNRNQLATLISEPPLKHEERLPLVEMLLAMLKRVPIEEVDTIHATLLTLVEAQDKQTPFAYYLTRVVGNLLTNASVSRSGKSGSRSIAQHQSEAATLLSILSFFGHDDLETERQAYGKGWQTVAVGEKSSDDADAVDQYAYQVPGEDWFTAMDEALAGLNKLSYAGKQQLVEAMSLTVAFDHKLTLEERELLRVGCALIHVPVPLLSINEAVATAEAGTEATSSDMTLKDIER